MAVSAGCLYNVMCAGSLLFTMDAFIPFLGSGKATFAPSVSPRLICCLCGEIGGRLPPSSYSVAWSGSVMLHGCRSTTCQKRSFSACYTRATHLVDPASGGETVYDQICNHSAHLCVCVSYRSKGVRDNSRRFMHISKKKITTAAVGPFIS